MEGIRYSLDTYDNTITNRALKVILGLAGLFASVYFIVSVSGSAASTVNTWVAIVFLFLFGIWGLLSGSGIMDRFLVINEADLIMRQFPFGHPFVVSAADIETVSFGPLTVTITLKTGQKHALRLGTYNRDRSYSIMEEIRKFCERNNTLVSGLGPNEKEQI